MRIKKKNIRELDTDELKRKSDDVFNTAKQLKQDFKSIGMDDEEATDSVAGLMSSSNNDEISEVNQEVLNNFIKQYGKKMGEKIYYATANKQGRDPESFELDETGEDFGDIPTGRDVEVGADDYEEYQNILRSLGDDKGIKYNDDTEVNDLPFESSMNETITSEYEERINAVISMYFPGSSEELKQAAVEWASIKAARAMGGRYHTDSLFKDFSNKYDSEIQAQAIDVVDMANDDAMFESVKPKMTKKELTEAVLGKKSRRVIKTLKVKDIKK
jgi:hypothetical protein